MSDATTPKVSVVIPAHNAADTIRAQLDALLPQVTEPGIEIVVVDNMSTDGTCDVVREYTTAQPNIRIVDASARRGPSYARNAGAESATGEYLLFCDADDIVGETWVASLSTALREHEYAGGPIEVLRLNPVWLADGRGRWGVDKPGVFGDLPFAHGCNLAIRRATYFATGGLDEEIHIGEEIDLAIRLRRMNVNLTFVPEAFVHYRYRNGLTVIAKQAYGYGRMAPMLERRGNIPAAALTSSSGPRRLAWLVVNLPKLLDRAGRIRWVWTSAGLCGRTVGRMADR